MKPLGRLPSRFPGKTDCHPINGYVNWWEAEITAGGKDYERTKNKKFIVEELVEYTIEKNKKFYDKEYDEFEEYQV